MPTIEAPNWRPRKEMVKRNRVAKNPGSFLPSGYSTGHAPGSSITHDDGFAIKPLSK